MTNEEGELVRHQRFKWPDVEPNNVLVQHKVVLQLENEKYPNHETAQIVALQGRA